MALNYQGSSGLKIKTNISEASEESKDDCVNLKNNSTRNSFNMDNYKKKDGQSTMLRTFFMIDQTGDKNSHNKRHSNVDIQIENTTNFSHRSVLKDDISPAKDFLNVEHVSSSQD